MFCALPAEIFSGFNINIVATQVFSVFPRGISRRKQLFGFLRLGCFLLLLLVLDIMGYSVLVISLGIPLVVKLTVFPAYFSSDIGPCSETFILLGLDL